MHSNRMDEERQTGIVLKTVEKIEKNRIVSILMEESGMTTLIVKGLSQKPYLFAATSPFTMAEFVYKKSGAAFFPCREASIIETHPFLWENSASLREADKMRSLLLQSQLPVKGSGALFSLFLSYLRALKTFPALKTILFVSFYLKCLKHEGKIGSIIPCPLCGEKAISLCATGEIGCPRHFKGLPIATFCPKEGEDLRMLMDARSFRELSTLQVEDAFLQVVSKSLSCIAWG